jgi:hypothetical protein
MSDEHPEGTVDLAYIGRSLRRLTTEVASLRDDMQVLTAIVDRLDNSHARLLDEVRATQLINRSLGEPASRARKTELSRAARVQRRRALGVYSGEKALECAVGFVRRLLRQEMAALDGVAGDGLGMVAPDAENVVTASLGAALAPQHQQRHRDAPAAVGAVVDEVDRRAGAVLVASRPDRLRVPEAAQILGEHLRLEHHGIAEHMAQKEFGLGADQPLRQSARLNQEKPVILNPAVG